MIDTVLRYFCVREAFPSAHSGKRDINYIKSDIELKPYEIPTYIEFIKSMPRKMGTEKVDYDWLEQDAIKKTKNR